MKKNVKSAANERMVSIAQERIENPHLEKVNKETKP
jgi:hypothetical protein